SSSQFLLIFKNIKATNGRFYIYQYITTGSNPDYQELARLWSAALIVSRILCNAFSVVSQSIQASVTDTPYLRSHKLAGMFWFPAPILLSTIKPIMDLLPS